MKSKSHSTCFLAIALTLATTAFAADTGLRGGTAIVDVTPQEWPLTLRGSFFPKPAKSTRDPLHFRALAFENGKGRAVIVIVDLLGISREVLDAAKKRAAETTGWRTDQMLIAATHTHSEPSSRAEGSAAQVAFGKRLANGSYGYLPTPKHHELGGYETWLGTSKVQKDGSDLLTRDLLKMLNELHSGKGK